ncbi:MAG: hypothetical protein RJB62_1457, partial [Pseudomonadota bacterium]
ATDTFPLKGGRKTLYFHTPCIEMRRFMRTPISLLTFPP